MAKQATGKKVFENTGYAGVYTTTLLQLEELAQPWLIDGRPVTAITFDPQNDQVVYVTTLTPETLEFLDAPWFSVNG